MSAIKNWRKFQHFKNRRPPWVKLYRELLDDPEWNSLDGDAAKNLVMLWLIASEDESKQGMLPDIRTLAFRLRITEASVKQLLSKLSYWIVDDDINVISPRYQLDTPETETETETYLDSALRADKKRSGKSRKAKTIPLPEGWRPNANAIILANSLNVDLADTEARFRDYLASSGKEYVDYDAAFRTFIRNQPKFNGPKNVSTGPRQLQDDKLSVSKAIDGMQERVRAGTIEFAPRPRLVPLEGEGNRRLLSKG
jgi:hypothetical protein